MQIANRFDKPRQVERILIIQLGDIGDVVWSLPTLQAVRDSYPRAALSVLLRKGNGSLLAADVRPLKVFEVPGGKVGFLKTLCASLELVWALRRERFDLVFDLRGDERGGYMAFLTGAPIRAAQYYASLPWPRNRLFTHLVPPPPHEKRAKAAAEQSLQILRAFGIETVSAIPRLQISDAIFSHAAGILSAVGITTEALDPAGAGIQAVGSAIPSWVTINPFSRWSYKEWGMEKWAQVIDWLGRTYGISSVIVGSPAERSRADALIGACSVEACNLAGRTTLAELAGVLRHSPLHIGVDSAAPHIAAAVGTPTVTLYGPSPWHYWAPPGEKHRVVALSDMDCIPCGEKGCDGLGASRCLENLGTAQVEAVLGEILSGWLGPPSTP